MKFHLNHDPANKIITIPRAALQFSGLADVSDLILHTDRAVFCCCREIPPWQSC